MAHEVLSNDTGFMVHKPAWHGLFETLRRRPKTIKEARRLSGITWDIATVPFIPLPHLAELAKGAKDIKALLAMASEFAPAEYRALMRDDDYSVTGVWSDEGVPITNQQGLEFMEAVLGQTLYEGLFSIRGGRNVCLLSQFPEWITVGGDEVRNYLYTRLDHTGAGSMLTMVTPVRVQCANTDRMAVDEASARDGIYRVRHMGDTSRRLQEARDALEISVDYTKQFKKAGDKLAKARLTEAKLKKVIATVYPAGTSDKAVTSAKTREDLILSIFRGQGPKGDTSGNAPGTKWCAWNAMVEYNQHYTTVRTRDESVKAERLFVRATEDPQGVARQSFDLITAA